MKQEEFDKLFNRPDLTSLGTLLVFDKFGEIIYSTDDSMFSKTIERYDGNRAYVSDTAIIEKLKQKNHYIDSINFISGWKTAALIPENKIDESFNDIKKIVFILLGIFMVISIVLVWFMSNRFTKPLRKLQRDIREVEKGNFKIRAETDALDEIGDLSNSFNKMVEEIERLIEKISINERKKKQIEMQSLQYQINPHFLYNTLNSVQWIARLHKVPDISEMLTSLIKLLRASLNSTNYLHTLEQELEMLDFYLKIQKQRYPDSFLVEYLVDSDLLTVYIPRFILQPLVENIFFHAFADGQGKISIEVTEKNHILQIAVKDNGRGMDVQTAENILNKKSDRKRKTSSGIGIHNVEDKIKLYFGSMYGLRISSEKGLGTTIFIHFPITFEQVEDEEVAKRINSR
jgi:two-component system sensor histidine kinase YesM